MTKMISILSFFFTFSAYGNLMPIDMGDIVAGSGSTGGGFVVFCKATSTTPEKVQLLDLYEAEKRYGFKLVASSGDIKVDYFRAIDRAYTLQGVPHLAEEQGEEVILHNLTWFFKKGEFVTDKKDLPYINDVGKTVDLPKNCGLEQVVLFKDEPQKAVIYKPLWDKLTSLEQSALIVHEVHGHWYRMMGDQTTEAARNYVAHLYAQDPGLPRWHGVEGGIEFSNTHLAHGEGPDWYDPISNFYLVQFADATRIQFANMFGRGALVKTYIDLPKVPWKLKAVFGDKKECLVNTPGLDISGVVPVEGTMGSGYEVEYRIKHGEPIQLALLKGAFTIARNTVSTCH